LDTMRLHSFLTLRQWLTVPFTVLVLGVALLIGALSYSTGSQAVDTVSTHLLQETVARIGQAVDRHVVGSAAVLEAAFPNGMAVPEFIDGEFSALRTRFWIATSLHMDPNNYVYYGNKKGQAFGLWRFNAQDAELRYKLQPDHMRKLSRFTGINGALGDTQIEDKLFEPRSRPWYIAGETSASHTWTSIYIDFRTAELVATRARRVLGADGSLQGVVATDMSLQKLNEFVKKLSISREAVAFIIEPDGKLIASSGSANTLLQPDGTNIRINASESDHALQRAAYAEVKALTASGGKIRGPVTHRFTGPKDQAVEMAFDRVIDAAGLDWVIVVAVPRSDFMNGVTANVRRSALIGLLAAMAAVALGLGILAGVARDLNRLTTAVREVGEGQLNAPLDVHRKDEIGALAITFRNMQYRLRTDMLTGLSNREMMYHSISSRIEQKRRTGDALSFLVLFVDLNNFKLINDRIGHDGGDRALMEVAQRLSASTRAGDLVARYAGDEFVLMIDDVQSREAAEQIRANLELVLAVPLETVDMSELPPGMSTGGAVGLALYPADGTSADDLIQHADHDMYGRKRRGTEPA
jgi:diguanylate cyclase (GGDEF)-like protein